MSEAARVYATLAAISGQLFLAILVARLVGIHTAQQAAGWGAAGRRRGGGAA